MNNKLFFLTALFAASTLSVGAQSEEGVRYTLPQTAMHFTVKVEKTKYTPGEYAIYSRRFLRKDAAQQPSVSFRILSIEMTPKALPDTAKTFTLLIDKKHSIANVERTTDGRLLAINATVSPDQKEPREMPCGTEVISRPHPTPLNPRDYMTEEILQAGSTAKMAELTAQEIFDIRDSRNQLSRGEADFMPKDGAQMKLMLANLNTQEEALSSLFEGITLKDTLATTLDFLPTKEGRSVLFRFSRLQGVVDADDLSGAPYYISVEDLHDVATDEPQTEEKQKEDKNDIGLRTALPGKIHVTLTHDNQTVDTYDVLAPQFGTVESLSGELFGKKQSTRLILDPLTGSVTKVETINND
ncbi:MAG: DUF4831 family protein [Prevotella sp.]|jgi:hypothetical protein